MARSIWTGAISFGLISIPVKLFTAVRPKGVSFNQLDGRTMSRIRYEKVAGDSGEVVPPEHIVKGVEVSKDRYVLVDPDELAPFVPLATKTIDLEEFVEPGSIDPVLFDTTYHLGPAGNAKPYVVLVRAMERAGKVGIARLVMRGRQYVAAVRAVDGRLVMSTLVYADEVVPVGNVEDLAGLDDIDVRPRGEDGRGARRLVVGAVRPGQVSRRLPSAGPRPDQQEGRRRGVRAASSGRSGAAGGGLDGRIGGERRRRQAGPQPAPVSTPGPGGQEGGPSEAGAAPQDRVTPPFDIASPARRDRRDRPAGIEAPMSAAGRAGRVARCGACTGA